MTPLEYLIDAAFECGPGDANVAAFIEATSILGGCDTVEEFLPCGIWSLSEKCEFEVETRETPISKVIVPIPKATPTIGNQESEATFEVQILVIANLLVSNYNATEHNAYIGFRHG
jgi:hypothetical protein